MKKLSQSGFSLIELMMVMVLLVAIGVTGYYVWKNKDQPLNSTNPQTASQSSNSSTNSQSASTPTAPTINSTSDLTSALQALNSTDLTASNSDSSQLSSQAAGF